MKILYAIQGTGNGHLSRARDIIPVLKRIGEVDILISGKQADIGLPFPIKYKMHGLGFIFGKKGGDEHIQLVQCSGCGWQGRVSRYAGRCPKCNTPLGDQKAERQF